MIALVYKRSIYKNPMYIGQLGKELGKRNTFGVFSTKHSMILLAFNVSSDGDSYGSRKARS